MKSWRRQEHSPELPPALERHLGRPVTEAEILAWLTLGAAARRHDRPLLRPVVHGFVRGIGGAVATFPEDHGGPRLWLAAEDQEAGLESDDSHAHFPVTTCTTCGQHYYIRVPGGLHLYPEEPGRRQGWVHRVVVAGARTGTGRQARRPDRQADRRER